MDKELLAYVRARADCYVMLREKGVNHEKACRILRLYDLEAAG